MTRLLLLIPTASYRTSDFMAAADRLGIETVLGSDQPSVLEAASGGATIALDFDDPETGAAQIAARAAETPFDAIVAVDDGAAALAALAAERLGLPHNPPYAIENARNKYEFRRRLAEAGLPSPDFRLVPLAGDAAGIAREISYPCVLKPLSLAMSRGVIRADGDNSFVEAFHRVAAIIARPDARTPGMAADHLLIESYIQGDEYAVEGLIRDGRLEVLAIFDKPEPMEGPFFEETIYVAPAEIGEDRADTIAKAAQDAVAAIGLADGPTHIDLRVNDDGVFILEADARSIGGHCGRSLRFAGGARLEEIILRHAAGLPIESLDRAEGAGGVMMIPIPASGVLHETRGIDEAMETTGIDDVSITIPPGQTVEQLPEGGRYLGFIIAHAATRDEVIAALNAAHARLEFVIGPDNP
jgi:biotin carboxylase